MWKCLVLMLLLVLPILACGPAWEKKPPVTPTATSPPLPPPPAEEPCGDGECDERERQNPELCPTDCVTTTEGLLQPIDCVAGEWWLVIAGCDDMTGTEPSTHLCSRIEACIEVDADCSISGTGKGQYTGDCAYTSPRGTCSYEVECPDFSAPISGEMVSDTLRIRMDASQIAERNIATCAGVTMDPASGPFMQIGYGSALRNNGGILCEMPARAGAHADVIGDDELMGGNLTYDFDVDIYADCP